MSRTTEPKGSDDNARKEAKSIIKAMKHGVDMSDVFDVSPAVSRYLRQMSEGGSMEAISTRNALEYREKVQRYVDTYIQLGAIPEETDDEEAEEAETESDLNDGSPDGWGASGPNEEAAPETEA